MIINSNVVAVEQRTITRRSDGQQMTFEDVVDEQGTKWTARKDVANIARANIGKPAIWVTRTEQKGEFTNRYVDALEFNGDSNAVYRPAEQAMVAQQAIPEPSQAAMSALTAKDKDIHRQTAAKVAAVLVGPGGTSLDFWSTVQILVRYFDHAEMPTFLDPEVAETTGNHEPVTLDDNPEDLPF